MINTNLKYRHILIWIACLFLFGIGIDQYYERYYSVQAIYSSALFKNAYAVAVQVKGLPSTARTKSYSHINVSINRQINTPVARSRPTINKLVITPAKDPSALLNRMDKTTRNAFLSKLAIWRKNLNNSIRENNNNTSVAEDDSAMDAYEVLKSMGYSSRLPDAINIGVKKGGTTALMFYLKYHPQIQTSIGAKEVHYFDWQYPKGIRWYESQMKIVHDNQLVYEKTPRYFVHDAVARRVRRDLGDNIRFLLCVRDPVDRLVSDFHFSKHIRSSKTWKKQQTIESESQRFIDTITNGATGVLDEEHPFVLTSNYAFHFKRWLKFFRREQFLIIDSHEMITNVLGTLLQVESFLGLKPFFRKEMFYKSSRNETCLRIKSAGQCPPRIGSSLLPKPRVHYELQLRLRDYYRPYNQEFEGQTGMSFAWTNI